MPTLRLYFLGTFDIRYDGRPLPTPPMLKSQSLLAYLVLHRDRSQPRERLADLFWSDRPEHRARGSLSTALWHIRRSLPAEALILSDPHTVQFDPQADLWLDVDEFELRVSHGDAASLQAAVALYRGDFLDGFYDDWIINERYRLETLFSEALARLMAGQEATGEHGVALSTALRLLECDPLREDAHRLAMRTYCHLGQRNAALEQYRRCREIVLEELGTEPTSETIELYQAILEGRFEARRVPRVSPVPIPAMGPLSSAGRSPLDVTAPGPFVGREQEMVFLRECWQETETGQGRLVLIGGEAGVGKTRLIGEFANRLRWQGVRVLWGRCYEFERVLPYQPIAEALRSVLRSLASAELATFPAWALAEVGRLVPEVLERLAPSHAEGGLVTASPPFDQERAHLFEGVVRTLAELSSHGALLIVLEDLHWAAESTLQLLHYLVRHLVDCPVLIVGTFRPEAIGQQHPLFDLQRRLAREGLAKPVDLSLLLPAAVEAMVMQMSGAGEAAVPLARRLYQETEGNPFFLMEIVKALFATGLLHLESGAWRGDFARISAETIPLPAGVGEAIQVRVRRLDSEAQEALSLAAVLGREFDFDLLNAAWGRGEEATLEALDDLLRHRLIDEGSGAMGRDYAFTHHKVQEVVYAGIPRRHRQHAHARVGAAMEWLYGPQVEALAGELAHHFEQGRELDDALTAKAITCLLQAGDRARGLYAHREAIDYYQRALALLKERSDYERAARTLMKLGLTYHTALDFQQARRAYDEGCALWQRAGQVRPAVLPPAPHALRVDLSPALLSLDPITTDDFHAHAVIKQLFSGLVELTPDMDIVPDVARGWDVLEGGRKYVFHLRHDVRWSDGVLVTAGDFEYAWMQMLDPATGSPNADLLYDVEGARAFHQGQAGREDIGIQALDKVTLAVELEEPTGYFLYLLDLLRPVPRHVVEAHIKAWTDMEHIVTNGPFRLETWRRGGPAVLVRNPDYCGRFTGNVERVELPFPADPSVRLGMYEADALDVLALDRLLLPEDKERARQRHAGEYVPAPAFNTRLVLFDVSRPPFDDPRVRRAFVLAADKETLVDVVQRGYHPPATGGLVPPGMPGHSPGIGLPYDPGQARQLLAEAGYPGGRGFPSVEALIHEPGYLTVQYLQAQWRDNLGVEIPWQAMEWGAYFDRVHREPPHMFSVGWSAVYPDPGYFLRVLVRSETRWRNATYDGLVEQARRLIDQEERMKLYRQADRILIEEAAVMPLFYHWFPLLVKPWVSKYPMTAFGWWSWKDVIIEPH